MPNHFLSCDWGASNFRLKLIDRSSSRTLAGVAAPRGIQSIHEAWRKSEMPDRMTFYRMTIKNAISQLSEKYGEDLSGCPLVLSGMASSSIGMKELPYAKLPVSLNGQGLIVEEIPASRDFLHDLLLISGVQKSGDVMRGEEMQAIGWHKMQDVTLPEYLLILPGTHSKHLRIKTGKIVDFQTYMTGELYQVLKNHSMLKNSVGPEQEWNARTQFAFANGVEAIQKGNLSNLLFSIRAKGLQGNLNKTEAAAYLSGLLIGNEFLNIPDQSIVLCADNNLNPYYTLAMEVLGMKDRCTFVLPEQAGQVVWRGQLAVLERKRLES